MLQTCGKLHARSAECVLRAVVEGREEAVSTLLTLEGMLLFHASFFLCCDGALIFFLESILPTKTASPLAAI
jgi:hypothetical protein